MIQVQIRDLTHRPEGDRAIVCLEDLGGRVRLALLVPLNEANRLARALRRTACACVPVFDMLEAVLAHFHARPIRAVLDGTDAGIWGALYVAQGELEVRFVGHAADTLALAMRAGVPIYAAAGALQHACPLDAPEGCAHRRDDLPGWLDRVRPGDFGERTS